MAIEARWEKSPARCAICQRMLADTVADVNAGGQDGESGRTQDPEDVERHGDSVTQRQLVHTWEICRSGRTERICCVSVTTPECVSWQHKPVLDSENYLPLSQSSDNSSCQHRKVLAASVVHPVYKPIRV